MKRCFLKEYLSKDFDLLEKRKTIYRNFSKNSTVSIYNVNNKDKSKTFNEGEIVAHRNSIF